MSAFRPDLTTRSNLAKKASELAENTRTSIRAARHEGQKDLKADQDNKVVGESDARRDAKQVGVDAAFRLVSERLTLPDIVVTASGRNEETDR